MTLLRAIEYIIFSLIVFLYLVMIIGSKPSGGPANTYLICYTHCQSHISDNEVLE